MIKKPYRSESELIGAMLDKPDWVIAYIHQLEDALNIQESYNNSVHPKPVVTLKGVVVGITPVDDNGNRLFEFITDNGKRWASCNNTTWIYSKDALRSSRDFNTTIVMDFREGNDESLVFEGVIK